MKIDADAVSDAIAVRDHVVSRRTVAKGVAWSLPVIASAVAATPAWATSQDVCGCSNGQPQNCFLMIGGQHLCKCQDGFVCVGTGPFGLANVCVATTLISTSCGTGSCYGVCLADSGSLLSFINTFIGAIQVFVSSISLLGFSVCTNVTIPPNICVAPFTSRNLGALCAIPAQNCGSTGLLGSVFDLAFGILTAAYNTLMGLLSGLGILVTTACDSPYVCRDFVTARIQHQNSGFLDLIPTFGIKLGLGFCACPGANKCDITVCTP